MISSAGVPFQGDLDFCLRGDQIPESRSSSGDVMRARPTNGRAAILVAQDKNKDKTPKHWFSIILSL